MENWCDLLTTYPDSPEPKYFTKALRTADTIIASDLAPFEIEWIVQTLLYQPIDAINIIISNRGKEEWQKNIADTFKLLSKIVGKYWIYINGENDKLVQLCQLPFDPQIRKEAIYCLINILKNPGADMGDAQSLINALESDNTCKAPLALLVGSVCRYCPERVDQNYNRIWRIYLNILQSQNKTDTIMNAVLQGIDGLLENFGNDIAIQELQNFYKDFSRKCAKISKCIETFLSILKSHCALFRERLRQDKVLRLYIWGIKSPNIRDALLSIYTVIFSDVPKERIEIIIQQEILPYVHSECNVVRHTALRLIINAKVYHQVDTSHVPRPDHLEFQMRYRRISHQEADLVSLCLESRESYVKSLLMSALMYYEHIPVTLRRDLVVKGIRDSTTDVRKVILKLLIELCKDDGRLDKYADIWRDILDIGFSGDIILKETLLIITSQLKSISEGSVKNLEEVLSLSNVLCFVLCASETTNIHQYGNELQSAIVELANSMCVCPSVILFSKYLCVEMLKPLSMLKELLSTFKKDGDRDTFSMIQMIFNSGSTDTKLLIEAVTELNRLLIKNDLDKGQVADIMKKVVKLKKKKTVSSSDSRIFQRDLTVFIGKYGHLITKEDFTASMYSLDLKNKIVLNLPNVLDGANYKIDLARMSQICLEWADSDMLHCLLTIISSILRDRPESALQSITWKCIHSLYRSDGCADVTPVLFMCVTAECLQEALQSIKEERNPEVRKKLCECLKIILLHDPGSEATGELLTLVAKELILMIKSTEEQIYQSGTDIAKVFLNTLQNNDNLIIDYLPEILIEISRKIDKELYEISTDIFIEKIDIFDEMKIKEMLSAIFKCMVLNSNRIDLEYILKFVKRIFEVQCFENDYFFNEMLKDLDESNDVDLADFSDLEAFTNLLQVLALSRNIFNLNEDIRKSIVTEKNSVIIKKINMLINGVININLTQKVLRFTIEYAVELLEIEREVTIECCCKLIENATPESLIILKKDLNDLSVCLRANNPVIPDGILNSCRKWCDKQNVMDISNTCCRSYYSYNCLESLNNCSDSIQSLTILSKLFDCRIAESAIWTATLIKHDKNLRQTIVSHMLTVSEKYLTMSDFGNMMTTDLSFVQKYLNVYFEKLLEYAELNTINNCIFGSIVKYYADNYNTYAQYYDKIVGLFDKISPNFESMSFEEQLSVASDYFRLPRADEIPVLMQWAKSMVTTEGVSLSQKIKIVSVLPGGEECRICYRYMAGCLPVRLSEVHGEHAAILRCLLDSLASNGDLTLLDIIVTLAAADDTKGWWDDALDACMSSLADRRDDRIFDAAYKACKKRSGLGGCTRVFVPLLKHSSRMYCEEYACKIIVDLLDTFKKGFNVPTISEVYRERVLSYAKAFSILQVIIDKVPAKNLELGLINMSAGYDDPWHVIKDVCVYSVTLRNKVRCPENTTDAIKDACLRLQCAAYNCLTAAICKRHPSQKQYSAVFSTTAWSLVIDQELQHDFTPRPVWNDNRIKRSSDVSTASTSSFTGTVRTRLFMATLSENPLQYDMIPNYEDEDEVEEEKPAPYENHPLNVHGILSTITDLLVHAATLHHTDWLGTLTEAVTSLPVNGKWTLAQAICNAELVLKPHASILAPALLELVATTPKEMNGRQVLNNLHIDILWTIIRWEVKDLPNYESLNLCIQYTISTCVEFKLQEGLFRRLLSTLNNLLQLYGTSIDIKWNFLETYCNDLPSNSSYLLPILQRILKNRIPLPGLLTMYEKFEPRQWITTSKLPEVFALALSLEDNKGPYLNKFWQILANIKSFSIGGYVKVLLYTQRVCWQFCNLQNLRIIADLAPKVEKSKCLSIIAVYLENMVQDDDGFCSEMFHIIGLAELMDSDCVVEAMKVVHGGLKLLDETMRREVMSGVSVSCRNTSAKIRKEAYRVMLKVFQDLAMGKTDYSAKRRAVGNTPILDIFSSWTDHYDTVMNIYNGIFDTDEQIANMMRDGVEECLSKDIAVRFAELFYIVFYFATNDRELADYGYVFLDLLFRDLQRQEGFKNKKLSDQPLPCETDIFTIQTTETSRSIDVQMSIADILETFLQSAKNNSQICEELLIEMMKRLKGTGRRFDLDETLGKLLADLLGKDPSSLTPLYIEASRIFLNDVSAVDGFKDALNDLKEKIWGSDCLSYYNILYEDFILKCEGRNLFDFSDKEEVDVEMIKEDQWFSIEGLAEIFGNLSNWNDLRIQDRTHAEQSLPTLLTQSDDFESYLRLYLDRVDSTLDYNTWFFKMIGVYLKKKLNKQIVLYKENWLKEAEKWPPRAFVTSAVLEAYEWMTGGPCDIATSDCLAEWAARLMIRSCLSNDPRQCHAQELKFCREANKRSLPTLALQCINRNKAFLFEDEALSWFHEKVVAHRILALRKGNTAMLRKALSATERRNADTNICLLKLKLQLQNDLGILSKPKLDEILTINSNVWMENESIISSDNIGTLKSVYDLVMDYYNDLWDNNDTSTQEDIICKMIEIIQKKIDHNMVTEHNLLMALLLNKLTQFDGTLSEDIAKKLLDLIASLEPNLDSYSTEVIKSISDIIPASIPNRYTDTDRDKSLHMCKQYLQLIRDPQYALLHYCDKLFYAKDQTNYKIIFDDMKNTLFLNQYGGTEYRSLNTIKNKLYGIENVDNIVARHRVLKSVMDELKSKMQRSVLRLSQLSPELTKPPNLEMQKTNLQILLSLPTAVYVVKFLEQVQVFKDAIRRPCVITAVLSDGTSKRYIIKSGEPLAKDASVQRAIAILPRLSQRHVRSYNVTALAKDAAIIEYLEDHERLRDLMGDVVNVPVTQRLADDKLVLSPSLALEQFRELCSKVPVHTLRSALETKCTSVQQFIHKKRIFLETLATMTITNWLFGVGDRHLHNILIDKKDGGICGVDWASTFQYGLREHVPARLTHNLLAVCDVTVLESRLQSMLLCLRENHRIYEAYINISFYCKGKQFNEIKHIRNILRGASTSYEITKNVLEESNVKLKEECVKTLDTVFGDFTKKPKYTVEEQVRSLLKHCTDERLLSITPQGWEAWL